MIFGPLSHTFRAYRLTNLMTIYHKKNDECHFYGWQCLSLKLENRTVDFVFEEEEQLLMFIQAMEILI
jgi:hypothetical protein